MADSTDHQQQQQQTITVLRPLCTPLPTATMPLHSPLLVPPPLLHRRATPFDLHQPKQLIQHAQCARQRPPRTRTQRPDPADFPGRPNQHLPIPRSGFTPSDMAYGFSSRTPGRGDFLNPPSLTILAHHSANSIANSEPAHVFPKMQEQLKQSRRLGFGML